MSIGVSSRIVKKVWNAFARISLGGVLLLSLSALIKSAIGFRPFSEGKVDCDRSGSELKTKMLRRDV